MVTLAIGGSKTVPFTMSFAERISVFYIDRDYLSLGKHILKAPVEEAPNRET